MKYKASLIIIIYAVVDIITLFFVLMQWNEKIKQSYNILNYSSIFNCIDLFHLA